MRHATTFISAPCGQNTGLGLPFARTGSYGMADVCLSSRDFRATSLF
jgi:hypothetical protein